MITLKDLSFAYNGQSVLQNVSCEITEAEFVGIIGPNGAGKSTLLKLIDRILLPQNGEIRLKNKPVQQYTRNQLARLVGYVQQDFHITYNFTAREIVLMGRFPHQRNWGFDSAEDMAVADQALKIMDCDELKDRKFNTLSGGEKQAVVLASALAQEPHILLLDEPTAALDLKHQVQIYQTLKKLQTDEGLTIVTVTHDINLASQFCERIFILKEGRIISEGPVSEILQEEILQEVYETPLDLIRHPVSGLPVILPKYR